MCIARVRLCIVYIWLLIACVGLCMLAHIYTHLEGLPSISHNTALFSVLSTLVSGSFVFKYTHSSEGFKIWTQGWSFWRFATVRAPVTWCLEGKVLIGSINVMPLYQNFRHWPWLPQPAEVECLLCSTNGPNLTYEEIRIFEQSLIRLEFQECLSHNPHVLSLLLRNLYQE